MNEVKIIESLARHPNIVRYYKTFIEGKLCYKMLLFTELLTAASHPADQNLYIVMELVEGASLQDHFNSLTEKNLSMEESRIWRIFVQLSLGMRYLHKDKV